MKEWYKEHGKLINILVFIFVVGANGLIAYCVTIEMLDYDLARRLKFVIIAIAIGNLALYLRFG